MLTTFFKDNILMFIILAAVIAAIVIVYFVFFAPKTNDEKQEKKVKVKKETNDNLIKAEETEKTPVDEEVKTINGEPLNPEPAPIIDEARETEEEVIEEDLVEDETESLENKEETFEESQTESEDEKEENKGEESQEEDQEERELGKYHVLYRKEDTKWYVKREGSDKVLRVLETQAEAIAWATIKALNQDTSIVIHKRDGKIRKQNY
ncbi:MAG: DUF2188 domain-containing protein [Candidatus Izemoplasmatales bacterium]|jgi:type IV secretory pathway VirB10-like protein|nr:DUF2188 domain-containing protein [Candidatus Izemoplasmatales bacterium]